MIQAGVPVPMCNLAIRLRGSAVCAAGRLCPRAIGGGCRHPCRFGSPATGTRRTCRTRPACRSAPPLATVAGTRECRCRVGRRQAVQPAGRAGTGAVPVLDACAGCAGAGCRTPVGERRCQCRSAVPVRRAGPPCRSAVPVRRAGPPCPCRSAVPVRRAGPPCRSAVPVRRAGPPCRSAVPFRRAVPPCRSAVPFRRAGPPCRSAVPVHGAGASHRSGAGRVRRPSPRGVVAGTRSGVCGTAPTQGASRCPNAAAVALSQRLRPSSGRVTPRMRTPGGRTGSVLSQR